MKSKFVSLTVIIPILVLLTSCGQAPTESEVVEVDFKTEANRLAQEILLAVAHVYGWPAYQYREVELEEVTQAALQEIAGSYRLEEQGLDITVTVVDDHLRVEVGELDDFEIYPTAPDLFMDLSDGGRLRVERDEQGNVTALQQVGGPRVEKVR